MALATEPFLIKVRTLGAVNVAGRDWRLPFSLRCQEGAVAEALIVIGIVFNPFEMGCRRGRTETTRNLSVRLGR